MERVGTEASSLSPAGGRRIDVESSTFSGMSRNDGMAYLRIEETSVRRSAGVEDFAPVLSPNERILAWPGKPLSLAIRPIGRMNA